MKQDAYTYSYTGSAQTVEHLCNGYYKVELWGASGGDSNSYVGGKGSYVSGNIYFPKDSALFLYIGGEGKSTDAKVTDGGWNGGGNLSGGQWSISGSGGGATDIRLVSGAWNNASSLNSRIMVAGAGGGGNSRGIGYGNGRGGAGGGLIGYAGESIDHVNSSGYWYGYQYNDGGTQVSGGNSYWVVGMGGGLVYECDKNIGFFGKSTVATENCEDYGERWVQGGAGGGYYAGGGGNHAGAAGGSSYISGHTGSVAIAEGSTSEPRAVRYSGCTTGTSNNKCSIHYSDKYFTNTLMIDGAGYKWTNAKQGLQQMPNPSGGYYASGVGHSGNGAARITYLGTSI